MYTIIKYTDLNTIITDTSARIEEIRQKFQSQIDSINYEMVALIDLVSQLQSITIKSLPIKKQQVPQQNLLLSPLEE
jgi:hypothetical protein